MTSLTADVTDNTEKSLNDLGEDETYIKFVQFSSNLDPNFWFKVSQLKLEIDKLDEVFRPLIGYYNSKSCPYISLDCSSFNREINDETSSNYIARGHFINKNTVDSFKTCDKHKLLKEFGEHLLDDFHSGRAVEDPSMIPAFDILMYSDLKRYIFYFWFAFPSFSEPKYYLTDTPTDLKNIFSPSQFDLLVSGFKNLKINQRGFFGIVTTEDGNINIMTLKDYIDILKNNIDCKSVGYLVFADPSDLVDYPGWPLRNLLYLILLQCPSIRSSVLKVIALRGSPNSKFLASMLFNIKVSSNIEDVFKQDCIKFVGWNKNGKGMFGPKYVDLSKTMDPKKRAKESVDLNLKLMKWRIAPHLNLDIVAQSKCLIIGAGTLGCCVARNLMSWGVRNITFIDNGKVSYSNPVRQSLYTHADCVNSNYKAIAAADMLREIYPNINSTGVVMSIPMPGHEANIDDHKNVDSLSKLIEDHDVIFLLTDSRESRWLPTMLSTLHNKLAITSALGFDSYLVLRHGIKSQDVSSDQKLGCYFCNDVTAPGNTLVDKSLDQQCTVTRPGVSSIAGALAVELFVSCTQLKYDVPANANNCLGTVPHSIRGFISDFQQITPFTPSFFQCIACSPKVINDFVNKKEEFLNNVFTSPNYLEDLTGLTELRTQFENTVIYELDDSDVDDSGNCTERNCE